MNNICEQVLGVSLSHPPLPLVKGGDSRIRFFDPENLQGYVTPACPFLTTRFQVISECLQLLQGHMLCRPCEDINDSNTFTSGGTIEMMGNVVATYSILGEWDLSDMQAYADHSDYLPRLYEELMELSVTLRRVLCISMIRPRKRCILVCLCTLASLATSFRFCVGVRLILIFLSHYELSLFYSCFELLRYSDASIYTHLTGTS
ncbi:hypothetical protein EDD85DRAFT_111839 [Armillaria nabsnona]|nr:hypothetical protein EDD85DRAFT_111839 [Armillaria nabsnona]